MLISLLHIKYYNLLIRYYNWSVASALITATSIFHKQLPVETIEQLQDKHMAQIKPRAAGGGWWLPFYSRKVTKCYCLIFYQFLFNIARYEK